MPTESILSLLRYRVVNRITGAVVIDPLPHTHTSTWTIRAMQQGAPAQSAIGSFRIPLHPPGSEQYQWAVVQYAKLLPGSGEGYRIEGFKGNGDSMSGTPDFAGTITQVVIDTSGRFELSGFPDPWIAHTQRPFPGELLATAGGLDGSVARTKGFLAENIPSFSDQFNPYTSANYTSTNLPTLTSGTWASATDANGVNSHVVQVSTGTGALLISTTGHGSQDNPNNSHVVECIARLNVTGTQDQTNSGRCGVGISFSSANMNKGVLGYVQIKLNPTTNRFDADAAIVSYFGGVPTATTFSNVLTNVDDPSGNMLFNIQLQVNDSQNARLVVNGSQVGTAITQNPGTSTQYPFLFFAVSPNGATTTVGSLTNLLHGTRNAANANSTTAPFIIGSVDADTHRFGTAMSLPPTFLEMWTACATLEGWYWRYTPVYMTPGVRTMGKVDFKASPGTDRSASVRFIEADNLVSITQQGNADTFGSDVQFNGATAPGGGGIAYFRNLSAMAAYGWLSDVGMSLTPTEFAQLQRLAAKVGTNKGTPGASITATVLRDPLTADVWRELDTVTVHAPTIGLNYSAQLVLAYTFTEGSATQQLTLAQYSGDGLNNRRVIPGVAIMAGLFKSR